MVGRGGGGEGREWEWEMIEAVDPSIRNQTMALA